MKAWDPSAKIKQAEVEAKIATPEGHTEAMKETAGIFAKHANSEGLL